MFDPYETGIEWVLEVLRTFKTHQFALPVEVRAVDNAVRMGYCTLTERALPHQLVLGTMCHGVELTSRGQQYFDELRSAAYFKDLLSRRAR